MNPVLLTIVKLLVSSALLVLFYFALFRGKASYRASRVFLLSIPALSLLFSVVSIEGGGRMFSFASLFSREAPFATVIPAADFVPVEEFAPVDIETEAAVPALAEISAPVAIEVEAAPALAQAVPPPTAETQMTPTAPSKYVLPRGIIVPILYFVVVILFATVIAHQMFSLRRLRHRAERRVAPEAKIYFSHDVESAFSVLRSIYVNPGLEREKLSIVISHEKQHIAHRHYIDLAVMELFTILIWFNPLVWVIRRELRNLHEFEADHGTLAGGVDMRDYMLAILEETAGVIPVMANGLKSSMIKKRFLKMKTENKIRFRALRAILTVPFAATLLLFFAFTPADSKPASAPDGASSMEVRLPYTILPSGNIFIPSDAAVTNSDGSIFIPDGIDINVATLRDPAYQEKFENGFNLPKDMPLIESMVKKGTLRSSDLNRVEKLMSDLEAGSEILKTPVVIMAPDTPKAEAHDLLLREGGEAQAHDLVLREAPPAATFATPKAIDLETDSLIVRLADWEGIKRADTLKFKSAVTFSHPVAATTEIQHLLEMLERQAQILKTRYEIGEISTDEYISEFMKNLENTKKTGVPDSLIFSLSQTPEEKFMFSTAFSTAPGIKTTRRIEIRPAANEPKLKSPPHLASDFPAGFDFADRHLTVDSEGMVLDADGKPIPSIEQYLDYDGIALSNKRVFVYEEQHGGFPSKLLRIERGKRETKVTLALNIYWDGNWIFVDKETCLIDPKTGDRYMVRDIEGDEELGRLGWIYGLKGRTIEQTLIFPPLPDDLMVVDYFEPDNFNVAPNTHNAGGLRIKKIRIDDYAPKPAGRIIR